MAVCALCCMEEWVSLGLQRKCSRGIHNMIWEKITVVLELYVENQPSSAPSTCYLHPAQCGFLPQPSTLFS